MDADLTHLDPEEQAEVQRILTNGNTSHGAGDLSALPDSDFEEEAVDKDD